MITVKRLVPLAWRTLRHDRVRFAVTLTGIVFSVLLSAVVDSPPFQTRRGDAGETAASVTRPPEPKRAPPAHKKGDLDRPPEKKKDR